MPFALSTDCISGFRYKLFVHNHTDILDKRYASRREIFWCVLHVAPSFPPVSQLHDTVVSFNKNQSQTTTKNNCIYFFAF